MLKKRIRRWVAAGVGAVLVTGSLLMGGGPAAALTPQTCSYANAGSATYARTVCWLDMTPFSATEARSTAGQPMQVALGGGYTLSYTLRLEGRTVTGVGLPTYSAASLGRNSFTGVAGRPALYQLQQAPLSTTLTMDNIQVTGPGGGPVTSFAIVGADAESTDDNESIVWNSDQNMRLIDPRGNACDAGLTGVGTTTVTCTSARQQARTGAVVLAADSPTILSQQMNTSLDSRRQGVAFGILLSKVELSKTVASRVDPSDSFTVSVRDENDASLGTASTGTGASASTGEVVFIGQEPGSPVTLAETSAPSDLDNYIQAWSCTRNGQPDPDLPSGEEGTSVDVDVEIGDSVQCGITNTALPGSLTLQKIAGPVTDVNENGLRDAGDTIEYTFVVNNTGELTLEDLTISDPQVGTVSCPVTTLAPGASTTCATDTPYTFTATDQAAGAFTNTATALASPLGATTQLSSNTSATTTTLTAPAPALTLTKTATPGQATRAGENVTYTYAVTNTGNVPIDTLSLEETAFTGSGTAPTVSCPVTALAPGSSTTCTAAYTLTQSDVDAGVVTNTAVASGNAAGAAVTSPEDTATVTIAEAAALTLLKSVTPNDAASYVVGQELSYSFVVTNTGNVTVNEVSITEQNFTGSAGPLAPTCPATQLQPGAQVTCVASYVLTQTDVDAGELTNTAIAEGTTGSQTPVASEPSTVLLPAGQQPAITLTKDANPETIALAGDIITYTFTVTNAGNVTLTDVTVDETAFTGTGTTPVINCPAEVATLLPGETGTCTATYTLTQEDADGTSVVNTATATGTPPPSFGGTITSEPATATVEVVQNPALVLVKTATPLQGTAAGDEITYSFRITNTGDVTITDVTVDEGSFSGSGPLPAIDCPAEANELAPSATVVCTTTYVLTQADANAGAVTNDATATGTSPLGDTVTSPPSQARVPIAPTPGLSIVKTVSSPVVTAAGEMLTYTFLITNTGNVTLTGGAVVETAFSGRGQSLTPQCPAEITTLAPGEDVTCTATYTVTQADMDAGSVQNTAAVSATTPGGGTVSSPPSRVDVVAEAAAALTVEKLADPTVVPAAGTTVTYNYLVTNTGNVSLTAITITEGIFTGSGEAPEPVCPDVSPALAPGDTVTCEATYTVTQEDMDAGDVTNTATAQGIPPGADEPITSPPSTTSFSVLANPLLTVTKSADPTEVTSSGQTVNYSFVVVNTGNLTMTNVEVREVSFTGTGTPTPIVCPTGVDLAPSDTLTCTSTYITTQADVDAGGIDNTATVFGATLSAPGTLLEFDPSSARVDAPSAAALSLVKSATPIDASSFIVGGIITYTFVVTNDGNTTVSNIAIDEVQFTGTGPRPEATCPTEPLAPAAQLTCTATYTLTQADIDAGVLSNTAVAVGQTAAGTVESNPSAVALPGDPAPSLSLVKSATRSAGSIAYAFLVTNTGNVTVQNIEITEDTFTGTGSFPTVTCPDAALALAPGASVTCEATYTLTAADKTAGTIQNTAVAQGVYGDDPLISAPSSANVSVGGLAVTGGDGGGIALLLMLGLAAVGTGLVLARARSRKRGGVAR